MDNTGKVLAEIGDFNRSESLTVQGALGNIQTLCEFNTARSVQGEAVNSVIQNTCRNLPDFSSTFGNASISNLSNGPISRSRVGTRSDEMTEGPENETASSSNNDRGPRQRNSDDNLSYRAPASTAARVKPLPTIASSPRPHRPYVRPTTSGSHLQLNNPFFNPFMGLGGTGVMGASFGFNPLQAPFTQGFIGQPFYLQAQPFRLPGSY